MSEVTAAILKRHNVAFGRGPRGNRHEPVFTAD
jgi:hypothetical protein